MTQAARQPSAREERIPPHDLDAEAAVISAAFNDRGALDRILSLLRADDFYSTANIWVYRAVVDLAGKGAPVSVVSVAGWLRDRDRLQIVGGAAYLAELCDAIPSFADIEFYAGRVRDRARLRDLIAANQRILAEAYTSTEDAQVIIDRAEHRVYELARVETSVTALPLSSVMGDAMAAISKAADSGTGLIGIPTGLDLLDAKIAGLHEGEVTVIAARPGMGKTSLAMKIAQNVATPPEIAPDRPPRERYGVAVYSLEMPRDQLAQRMACTEAWVDLNRLRTGDLGDRDFTRLLDAGEQLRKLPIWIDDRPGITVLELRASVRRIQAEYNRPATDDDPGQRIGLVIIDYLQLMTGDKSGGREQEISGISRGLKTLSKELKVPVIALAQLSRKVEERAAKDKRPQLSDLRESGAIEQDADNIIFIYRDDYYHQDSDKKGIADLIIAKQRNGPTCNVFVKWRGFCARFDNLDPADFPAGE